MTPVHTPKQVSAERLQQIVAYVDLMGPNSEPCVPGDVAQSMAAELLTRRSSAGVKGLEWQKRHESEFLSRAETILGLYRVWSHHEANGEWFWSLSDGAQAALDSPSDGSNATEAEAKAACQADFNTRILSALEHVNETPKTEHVEGDVYSPSHAGEDDGAVAWKLVPVEPTEAMLKAFSDASWQKLQDSYSPTPTEHPDDGGGGLGYGYRAMLAAAPSPSVPPQAEGAGHPVYASAERIAAAYRINLDEPELRRWASEAIKVIRVMSALTPSPTLEPSDAEVERAALALYEEDDAWSTALPWESLETSQANEYRRLARAALIASRQPTSGERE